MAEYENVNKPVTKTMEKITNRILIDFPVAIEGTSLVIYVYNLSNCSSSSSSGDEIKDKETCGYNKAEELHIFIQLRTRGHLDL